MNENSAPPIGTILYVVQEHLYYEKDKRTSPFREYAVCPGTLKEIRPIRKQTELRIVVDNKQANNVAYLRLNDVGKTWFYTAREAALVAKSLTEKEEQRFPWNAPMRRSWEKLLSEESAAITKGGESNGEYT